MDVKKVYLCGAISGEDKQDCFEKFFNQESLIENEMYSGEIFVTVINPLRLQGIHSLEDFKTHEKKNWSDYMKSCIEMIPSCSELHAFPDWTKSKGARLEVNLALDLGIPVIFL